MRDAPGLLDLYRVTRQGHAGLFPPASATYRFDSPDCAFRTLYGAVDQAAAFAESLQPFRPDLETRQRLAALRFDPVTLPRVSLRTWASGREMLHLRLPRTARLLDLRQSVTIERLAEELVAEFAALDLTDFDASTVLGPNRAVTQVIARWAYAADFDGILYASRLAPIWTCAAVFDRVRPRILTRLPISPRDPDLIAVATSFSLRITG